MTAAMSDKFKKCYGTYDVNQSNNKEKYNLLNNTNFILLALLDV